MDSGGTAVRNLPANVGDAGYTGFDPWVKEEAAHSSILAWKIPWTEESQLIMTEQLGTYSSSDP